MEKIQVSGFFLQEVIISGLYIFETRKLLGPAGSFRKEKIRRVMRHLIYINLLIIVLDIVVLITAYANLFDIQVTFKGAVYSIKLTIEFAILNELIKLAGGDGQTAKNSKDVYWLSHGANETKRTGGGEIGLKSFDGTGSRNGREAPDSTNENGLGYSFSAGTTKPSQFKLGRNNSQVVKTTEVVVSTTDRNATQTPRSRYEGDDISDAWPGEESRGRKPMDNDKSSHTSSEVEFAKRGY
ncbi:hypothetical protein FGG08_004948 [Glutinoglossum americanum]|uniref:DUF7703 domain-containing protein n=1 Tax=Glutinoglossum americanum TaxID=1670608 RepID=A0A9P8IAD5_9PEZI|nr:hypothetical protein FGG08_004948 [Glutinoglossum americanum]